MEVAKTKCRAPTMTPEELSIISQFYVENYEVFHASLAGSSRQPAVKAKRDKLEELARILASAGYPQRTITQLDQRMRDSMKKAKSVIAQEKAEFHQTGGGVPLKLKVAPHIAILLDKIGEKPRLKGLSCAIEVCGDDASAQSSSSKRPSQTDNEISQHAPLPNTPSSSKPPPQWDIESHLSLTDTEDEVYTSNKHTFEKIENKSKKVKTEPIFEENFDDREFLEPMPVELHNDVEKENRPREKRKSARASELESERIQLRIRNEQLTGDLLCLQIENAKLHNENMRLKNEKLRLKISNEQKRGDYLDRGYIF